MGKIGRRGPSAERKKRMADKRERERIAENAKIEFYKQKIAKKNGGKRPSTRGAVLGAYMISLISKDSL